MHTDEAEALLRNARRATPFMVTDLRVVQQQVRAFRAALPSCDTYYAIKANHDRDVLQAIHAIGVRFEIASVGELQIAMDAGIPATDCIFSNPVKVPGHLQTSYAHGVREFAFDSIDELDKIAKYAPSVSVYLRVAVPDARSSFPLSRKFGADWTDAPRLAQHAQEIGLNMDGLTFHVGSQCVDAGAWREAIRTISGVVHSLESRGIEIAHLNLGGGFPVRYCSPVPSIAEIGAVITQSIEDLLPTGLHIRAEPGRLFVADASSIACTVIGRETRLGREWLYLDMGAFQGLIECLENPNWAFPIESTQRATPGCEFNTFTLSGPTCDPADAVGHGVLLPNDVSTGDRLIIRVTGAYSLVYASAFNGFAPPTVYTVR